MAKRELEIPNNSYKKKFEDQKKEEKEQEEKESPTAIVKHKTIGRRFLDTFIAEDSRSVGDYLLKDIIIPALESLFLDTLHQGIDAIFNRSGRPRTTGSKASTYHASYERRGGGTRASSSSRTHFVEDVIFDTRQDAALVKQKMLDLLEQEQAVSILEYYEIVEEVTGLTISGHYTDAKYGWMDLSGATVTFARGGGCIINLPSPDYLYG